MDNVGVIGVKGMMIILNIMIMSGVDWLLMINDCLRRFCLRVFRVVLVG